MLQDCDTWSETDSSDSLSQRIYTPTSSTSMNPSSTVSENHEPEHTPLLHGHPTPYEPGGYDEKVPNYVATPDSEVEGIKEPVLPKPVAIPGPSDHSNSCRRRRSRVVAHLVLVKIIPLLGSLGCLAWLFGNFNWFRYGFDESNYKHSCNHYPTNTNREIVVDNGPEHIWGKFPLCDRLSLSTTSGNIAVSVTPHPPDPDSPEPGELRIRTESGSVTVSFSEPEAARIPGHELEMEVAELKGEGSGLHQTKCKKKCQKKHKHRNKHKNKNKNRTRVLERPYIITIETTTGSISARLPVSLSTNLSTTSGSITVTIFPLRLGQSQSATDNNNISLVTSTDTGSQHIRLTEPISLGRSESEPWSEPESSPAVDRNSPVPGSQKASASHSSGQGNMHIAYPAQWAGSVHGESVAGDVLLSGRGLAVTEGGDGSVDGIKLDREGEDWWGAHMDVSLEAWREGTIFFYVG